MSFDSISDRLIALAREYGAKSLILFGSMLDEHETLMISILLAIFRGLLSLPLPEE